MSKMLPTIRMRVHICFLAACSKSKILKYIKLRIYLLNFVCGFRGASTSASICAKLKIKIAEKQNGPRFTQLPSWAGYYKVILQLEQYQRKLHAWQYRGMSVGLRLKSQDAKIPY